MEVRASSFANHWIRCFPGRDTYVPTRIRHVKCDETSPSCMRCSKTGRKCDGYSRAKKTESGRARSGTPSPNPSAILPALPKFDDPHQRESFGFFVSCTSSASSLYFGAGFWGQRVLQLSLSEPSVRYAVCSLSALHRMSLESKTPQISSTESKNYALQQYNHAVRCTRDLLAERTDGSEDKAIKGLVACVLFVCYENFIGNYKTAQMHLQNGLQIIAKKQFKRHSFAIPEDISQVFERLELQAMAFADDMAPYPYHMCAEPPLFNPPLQPPTCIEGAVADLLCIFRWIFRAAASWEPEPIPSEQLELAYNALMEMNLYIECSMKAANSTSLGKPRRCFALLKMYQIIAGIITATGVYGQEMLHDKHLSEYEEVVAFGEVLLQSSSAYTPSSSPFFSFDIGVIFPLFFSAIKCRDPKVRRRAIKLLESQVLQEGSWNSVGASKVAKFIVAIEEEGLHTDFSQHDVPEMARVHLVKVSMDIENGSAHLSCFLRSNLDKESWYMREGFVSLEREP